MIPDDIYAGWDARSAGAAAGSGLERACSPPTREASRRSAAEFERRMKGELPADWREHRDGDRSQARSAKAETIATRKASQDALECARPGAAGAVRRLGRPHRLEPHQRGKDSMAARRDDGRRATTSTTACASSA